MDREYLAPRPGEDLITITRGNLMVREYAQGIELMKGDEVIFRGSYEEFDSYFSVDACCRRERIHYLGQVSSVIDKYPEIKELFFGIPSDEMIWDFGQVETFLSFLEVAHMHNPSFS